LHRSNIFHAFKLKEREQRCNYAKRTANLIAGYVKQVAIVLERAPNKKAVEAERASGDGFESVLFVSLLFSSRFFS